MSVSHYEVRCMFCDVLLAQCRCPSPNKQAIPGLCDACRDYKGDPCDRRQETPRPLDGLRKKPSSLQAPAPQGAQVSTEADRPTVPDQPRSAVEVPLPLARAKALGEVLYRYARASADVKEAWGRHAEDSGRSYAQAKERKEAVYAQVIGVVEGALAYIGVHAQ